ncbi:MAG: hypothetical protein WKF59_19550 [Chitinophagaceae bacterium]
MNYLKHLNETIANSIFPRSIQFLLTAQKNPYWQEPTKDQADSLKMILQVTKNDTLRMYINRQLGLYYQEIKRAVALSFLKNN